MSFQNETVLKFSLTSGKYNFQKHCNTKLETNFRKVSVTVVLCFFPPLNSWELTAIQTHKKGRLNYIYDRAGEAASSYSVLHIFAGSRSAAATSVFQISPHGAKEFNAQKSVTI